ncbi:hypothetical protein [Actinophytocola sp.]|uniref:hypothetical protein n=1 Tax=Actinophytocola sp. TaxID=1872138 RepID=UPI00389ACC16
MYSTDTDPGIESELIDLSTISFGRLRELNSSALLHAMHHAMKRTEKLSVSYASAAEGQGERID